MKPNKTPREKALFIKWFPIFMNNEKFTEKQIQEYKQDLKRL